MNTLAYQFLGLNEKALAEVGFVEIMGALPVKSPFGKTVATKPRCYMRSELNELKHYFSCLANLLELYQNDDLVFSQTVMEMSHLREVRGSLLRLQEGDNVLDNVEFFELKRFLHGASQIAKETVLLNNADIVLESFVALQEALDPEKTGVMSFYIYEAYDKELALLRSAKRQIENQILGDLDGAIRRDLINQRQTLVAQEEQIEFRIRQKLTSYFAPYADALINLARSLGELDLMIAKVTYAKSYRLAWPSILPDAKVMSLHNGWLPKLVTTGVRVVRQSIDLTGGSTVLTGANMGGKSVALKTVVLNSLLVQTGMPVFAEKLQTPCFDGILYSADITSQMGAKLSSFGAEIMRLREAIELSDAEKWLIVLDEPARGTNPQEAEAIVCGVCDWFRSRTHFFLVATHYNIAMSNLTARYQVRGLSRSAIPECESDEKRLFALASAMDYRIMRLESDEPPPHEAFCICEWLGLTKPLMTKIYQKWEQKHGDIEH